MADTVDEVAASRPIPATAFTAERFWARVDRSAGRDACWPWMAYQLATGHGRLRVHGSKQLAHRVAFVLAKGPIPANGLILHSCDNPPCCNPGHLRVGTPAENAADRSARGRWRPPGSGNSRRPAGPRRPALSIAERFWRHVEIRGDDECWPWKAGCDRKGYGRFASYFGVNAHRTAYGLTNGPIPTGYEICHSCDNRACQNPRHLRADLHIENIRDIRRRGRGANFKGERNPRAKISEAGVAAIRMAYASGETQRSLAARYGVVPSTISWVTRGGTWSTGVPVIRLVVPVEARRRGEDSPRAKLTTADVVAIRDARSRGEPQAAVAARFGINVSHVYRIVARRCWAHVA